MWVRVPPSRASGAEPTGIATPLSLLMSASDDLQTGCQPPGRLGTSVAAPTIGMDVTVIVVTHNRAELLRATLTALGEVAYPPGSTVLIVDNNSNDHTEEVVNEFRSGYPVPLEYRFEPTPGKYVALNTGIRAARGSLIAATDDDALPAPDWLERAVEGLDAFGCDFVGGRVDPLWRGTPPSWLDARSAIVGKVLALQDHGDQPRDYGRDGLSWPLGVNVVYRRSAFDRVGLFDGSLGRTAGTLRNQSQRDWHLRARALGLRGVYLPLMAVLHTVNADRLTRRYFYRWFYWHGISRAIMYQRSGLHLLEPDADATHAHERRLLDVPLSIWRLAWLGALSAARRWLSGRRDEALDYELQVCFCAGVIRQRLADRGAARGAAAPAAIAEGIGPPA